MTGQVEGDNSFASCPPPLRILAVCHRVLYKQLSAWMLHGLLDDKHEEFFVEKADSTIVEAKTTVAEVPGYINPLLQLLQKCCACGLVGCKTV